MSERKFTDDHEWVEITDGVALVGITDHAQQQLGDLVFVELPEVGKTVAKGDTIGTLESVKVASDLYSPISGEIVACNDKLTDDPALLNSAAESDGWILKIRASAEGEFDGLMSADAYADFTK